MPVTDLMIGGKRVPCAAPVLGWMQTGNAFLDLPKRLHTTAVCLHWTGGANLAPGMFRTLVQRNLSVQFLVEPAGNIVQFCDADRLCQHAGKLDDDDGDGVLISGNRYTIGVEIVNPATNQTIVRGIQRSLVREKIHGHEQVASTFTAAQVTSTILLCEALCGAYSLPMQVPMDGSDVLATRMGEAAFRDFRGVLGHFHLTRRKRDPGLAILRAIAAIAPRREQESDPET